MHQRSASGAGYPEVAGRERRGGMRGVRLTDDTCRYRVSVKRHRIPPYFHHIRLAFAYKVNLYGKVGLLRFAHFMDLRRKVARGEAGGRFVITTSDCPGPVLRLSRARTRRPRYFHVGVAHFFPPLPRD